VNADAQTGVLGTGDGQVTIVVHSNVKGVIGQIKEKFAQYSKTLKPSLQMSCTPVISMKKLGTNRKSNTVTPSKIIKTTPETSNTAEKPQTTSKLTMTSSVTGHEAVNQRRRLKIYVDENTTLERLMIEEAKKPAPYKGKELSKLELYLCFILCQCSDYICVIFQALVQLLMTDRKI